MSGYFPKTKCLGANVKFELDLSNYATTTRVNTSDFAKKTDLASLKPDVDKLDIDKLKNEPSGLNSLASKVDKLDIGRLETTLVDLSKLNNVVKNYIVKKTEYNELVKRFNNINTTDTSNLVKKLIITQELMKLKTKLLYHDKYITTRKLNKLTSDSVNARIAQANIVSKNDIAYFVKKTDFVDEL